MTPQYNQARCPGAVPLGLFLSKQEMAGESRTLSSGKTVPSGSAAVELVSCLGALRGSGGARVRVGLA